MALSVDQIRSIAERVAVSHSLDVVEVEYHASGKNSLLRVSIEKNRQERARLAAEKLKAAEESSGEGEKAPQYGHAAGSSPPLDALAWVTHEDCELFSRDFGAVLDAEEAGPRTAYTLEVSSPGLERKLRGMEDYKRFLGSMVKIQTIVAVWGNRRWQGRLTVVKDGAIVLVPAVKQAEKAMSKGRMMPATPAPSGIEIRLDNIQSANLAVSF